MKSEKQSSANQDSKLYEADSIISIFYSALKRGEHNLDTIPGLLLRIINEDMWQERIMKTGETVKFTRFIDFVTTKPLEGLGESLEAIKRLCRDDAKALDAIDKVTVKGPGNPTGNNQYGTVNNVNNSCIDRPVGNSKEQALRRLRKSRPDLHEQVKSGQLSAHSAMIQAGFRKQTVTLVKEVDSVARFIARTFTEQQINEIIRLAYLIREKPELVEKEPSCNTTHSSAP